MMNSDDPREVVLTFLTTPSFVTTQTKGAGGWVAHTGGGGLAAASETVVFVKERHLPKRAAYNVRFTDSQSMKRRFTVSLVQGDDDAWQVTGGAGGSAEEPPENAPKRGFLWANLGGGG
jgi:hypothetical protein